MLSLKTALSQIASAITEMRTEPRLNAATLHSLPYTATQDCICVVGMNPSTSSIAYASLNCGEGFDRQMMSSSGVATSCTLPLREGNTLKVTSGSNYGTINALVFPLN